MESAALAEKLPAEVDDLLSRFSEDELGGALRSLAITYDPTEALNTNRGWLTEMAKHVRKALDERS